jgi:CO/xanthine dehydrogenase Mo-binding subunit/aerobic-type carbon monoxide dehydrogenase small subunit (CoxS/CutS family)
VVPAARGPVTIGSIVQQAARSASVGNVSTGIIVNGEQRYLDLDPAAPGGTLLALLRSGPGGLGLTGTKPGCGEGECGACTVLVDGSPVLACQTAAADVAGRSVTTIEGLAAGSRLHPVQQALAEEHAFQCGYCTPAMALRAAALLAADPDPGEAEVRAALEPNLCRCGCYPRIARAVRRASALLRDPARQGSVPVPEVAEPLARPRRPWDLTPPAEREYFDILGDGLVVVWQPPGAAGGAWVHVSPSGTVTAFTGKVDIGQDNRAAFRLLVAEELAVDPGTVTIVQGDTDLCPWDPGTFGSRSMPEAGEWLRRAAAGARQVLASLAGPRGSGGPGDRVSHRELLDGVRRLEVLDTEPALRPPTQWRIAGLRGRGAAEAAGPVAGPGETPAVHEGAAGDIAGRLDVVTGGRRYASDVEVPGVRYGAVLRPPVRGAKLRAADTRAAAGLPGVTTVRDGDFVGVTAPDLATARQAVAAIEAGWDRPPTLLGPGDQMADYLRAHPAPGSGQGWQQPLDHESGDTGAALAAAPITVQATYATAYLAHVPLETRAAVAEWTDGRLTVWSGNNVPFRLRAQLAETFGIPQDRVRVVIPPTGGGFGGKHGEEAIEAARLARATGTPVKVHWSRAEEFRFGYVRPMAVIDIRAGLDPAGGIAAFDLENVNAGAQGTALPYRAATWRLRFKPAASPLAQGPYRALAATANTFARETALDELAHAAGCDPLRFRLDQLADERLGAVLRAAADRFGWEPGPRPQGVALGMEKNGRVATCAEVAVDPVGAIRVTRIVTAYECGAVVSPATVVSQIEGGTVMALGGALFEQVALADGYQETRALARYRVPRFADIPRIDVVLVDRPDIPPAGAGETPLIAVAPAIGNAIFAATGRRLRALPLTPE